jgi:hypothetical protein
VSAAGPPAAPVNRYLEALYLPFGHWLDDAVVPAT